MAFNTITIHYQIGFLHDFIRTGFFQIMIWSSVGHHGKWGSATHRLVRSALDRGAMGRIRLAQANNTIDMDTRRVLTFPIKIDHRVIRFRATTVIDISDFQPGILSLIQCEFAVRRFIDGFIQNSTVSPPYSL